MKLDLKDLMPKESTLVLSEKPGKVYTLQKISLRVQIWISERFGKDRITSVFDNRSLPEISEITHYLIKDKTDFPTLAEFQDLIVTQQDRINLIAAIMESVGISQPIIKKITEAEDEKNEVSLSPPTGADSTTSSPLSTTTP